MPKKYYTLAVLPNCEGRRWSQQFGDYDRAVVAQELRDTRDDWPKGSKFLIISTDDGQAAIDTKINELNRELFNAQAQA